MPIDAKLKEAVGTYKEGQFEDLFDRFVMSSKCVGFRDPPITLKEPRFGQPVLSPFYVNMRNTSETVKQLKMAADYVFLFCHLNKINGDYFLGVPEGATKLGVAANIMYCTDATKVPLSRSKPKDHGDPKDKYYVTPVLKGEHPIVLEDVNTTGDGLIKEIKKSLDTGAEPVGVTLVSRLEKRDSGETVVDVMKTLGVPYYCMSNTKRLLPLEFEKLSPEQQDFFGPRTEAYYDKYGAIRLTANDLKRTVA
jgi:orotate phosphoribosyltransferase